MRHQFDFSGHGKGYKNLKLGSSFSTHIKLSQSQKVFRDSRGQRSDPSNQ